MFKDSAFVSMMKTHLANMSLAHRMAFLVRLIWGSRYGWGDEVIGSADCSGSVFFALHLMGFPARLTAHQLRHHYTQPRTGGPEVGDLAFWWSDDKVKHVATFVEKDLLLNAEPPVAHTVRVENEVAQRASTRYEVRRIDWTKLETDKVNGDLKAYGVAPELKKVTGIFAEEALA